MQSSCNGAHQECQQVLWQIQRPTGSRSQTAERQGPVWILSGSIRTQSMAQYLCQKTSWPPPAQDLKVRKSVQNFCICPHLIKASAYLIAGTEWKSMQSHCPVAAKVVDTPVTAESSGEGFAARGRNKCNAWGPSLPSTAGARRERRQTTLKAKHQSCKSR